MQTVEPVSTREATERLVKILDSTYVKSDLEQVAANASQLDIEERSQRLSLLQNFNYLLGVTIGDWETEIVDLDLNPDSKQLNFKYYPVPILKKDASCNDFQCLVKTIF